MRVFAIESSCDDTSISIVNNKKKIELLKTINHRKFHHEYGGVIPEIAARQHLDIIGKLNNTIKKIDFGGINAIAATHGPGLIGSLIVGSSFAKGVALGNRKPLVPINHLQSHLLSPRLSSDISFPYLCLLVSGGNTALVLVKNARRFITLGKTIDDSAGECFDKVAKAMGLGYPGGPIIEKLAINGDENKYKLPLPLTRQANINFSFSGLKTASIDLIKKNKLTEIFKKDFAASFQTTIGKIFLKKIETAIDYLNDNKIKIKDFSICGGVAANKFLNSSIRNFIENKNLIFHQVPLTLCTDNAAMIAWNALELLEDSNKKFKQYNVRPTPNILIHENFI